MTAKVVVKAGVNVPTRSRPSSRHQKTGTVQTLDVLQGNAFFLNRRRGTCMDVFEFRKDFKKTFQASKPSRTLTGGNVSLRTVTVGSAPGSHPESFSSPTDVLK